MTYQIRYRSAVLEGEQRGIEIGQQRGIEIGQQRGIEIGQQRGIEIGQQRGIEIGQQRGIEQKARETALLLQRLGKLSTQEIAAAVGYDLPTVSAWLSSAGQLQPV